MTSDQLAVLTIGLDTAVRATGVPLVSVRVGNGDDRTTWEALLAAGATPAQQATADAAIAAFDISTLAATALQQQSDQGAQQKIVIATIAYVFRKLNGVNPTLAQLQTELALWKAIFRALP